MKRILYYEVVVEKGEIIGDQPEYGIGPWYLMLSIETCEKLSNWFLTAKIYLERYAKREKGKIEEI